MLLIKQRNFLTFNPFEMADENEKLLMELMKQNENSICADCKRKSKYFIIFNKKKRRKNMKKSFSHFILFYFIQHLII